MNSVRVYKMTNSALIEELKTLVDTGKVLTDADSLEVYGKDWTKLQSKYRLLCVGPINTKSL